ncbi:NUDIX hydrolase [Streptomyces tsukubensis]|uniref:NUDIX hydrolase n=1 Tax=Streptomyces tsukubensis TaxID=83656 RepID=UPI00344FE000
MTMSASPPGPAAPHRPGTQYQDVVVAVVTRRTGGLLKVLVVRRCRPQGRLVWSFPSGKIEPGETAVEAGRREVYEESGVDADITAVLGRWLHPDTQRRLVYVTGTATGIAARPVEPGEIAEARWVAPGRLNDLFTTDIFPPVRAHLGLSGPLPR